MRLVCLECSAAYEAPDNLFGSQPREVRCNRCGYQWTVVGSRPEESSAAAIPILDPAEAPMPMPVLAPPSRPEPLTVPSTPPPSPPPQGSARLADTLAGDLPPRESLVANEPARPMLVVEPAAESTRTLLAGSPKDDVIAPPPDPEERRLSHELDFGKTERYQRTSDEGSSSGRRIVLILILLIILAAVAAVVFKTEIVSAFPALTSSYGKLGL